MLLILNLLITLADVWRSGKYQFARKFRGQFCLDERESIQSASKNELTHSGAWLIVKDAMSSFT